MTFVIKRIYEPASPRDGIRVLVDRLWPRGVKKRDASMDLWKKEVTPVRVCAFGSVINPSD